MNTLTPLKHVAEVSGRVGWHGLSTDDYLTEGEFLVTGTDIRSGKVAWESCHRVSESRWSQDPRIQLGHGDVLITKDGTIGKIALVRELPGRATLNSGVFRVRPSEQLLGGYLFRVLESRLFTDFVNLQGHGSTINHLYERDVVNLKIPLSSIAEQQSIIDYLDRETARIDALIEKKEKLSALLVEHEHSKIRNLVSCATEMSPVVVTNPPADGTPTPPGWRLVPLRSICTFETGKAHENFVSENGTYICVNSRFVSTEGRVSKRCDQNLSPARKNDILMVMSDLPNGRALAKAFFVESDDQFAVNQRVCIIRPCDIEPKYAFYQLDRNPYFLAFDDGSNQTHLSSSCFTSFKIMVPPQEEQLRIVKTLDAVTATRRNITTDISSQIEKLSEFRQALITAAVTGELEVPGVAA